MNFNIEADIARVHFVNTEKYTVDMVGINGTKYKDLPFLSLYSKPNSQGQGVYMMPERDSYGIIVKLQHKMMNSFLGADKFVVGFYNPIDDEGNYSSGREEINPGDFVAKTVFGNKMIGRTDGSITIMASDQSQMTLYPASGNKQDSWGFDNLLRAIFENLEINTDGGHIHHHVNKKEKTTNLNFEIRNKPLMTENPDIVRGDIGSQGAMGNDEYFTTVDVIKTSQKGDKETVRQRLKWKTTGWKKIYWYNSDGKKKAEYTITKEVDRTYKTYDIVNDEPVLKYKENTTPAGDITKERYNTSTGKLYLEETIDNKGNQTKVTYTGEDPNAIKKEVTKNSNGTYSKKHINPGTGNPYFTETLSQKGTRVITKSTGGNPNAQKSKVTIKDDGSLTKSIWNPPGGVEVYKYNVTVDGIVTETIKDPDGNKVMERTKDNTGIVNEKLGKDNKVTINLDGTTGNVDITAKKNANLTVEGNLNATVNGTTVVDCSDVTLGGTSGYKVLTTNTTIIDSNGGTCTKTTPASNVKAK